jgi:hypothetical protein
MKRLCVYKINDGICGEEFINNIQLRSDQY